MQKRKAELLLIMAVASFNEYGVHL